MMFSKSNEYPGCSTLDMKLIEWQELVKVPNIWVIVYVNFSVILYNMLYPHDIESSKEASKQGILDCIKMCLVLTRLGTKRPQR